MKTDAQKLAEKAASKHMWFSQKPTMTPEAHVQQLMIDLHQAHEENKQLRKSVESLSNVKDTSSAFGLGLLIGAIISGPIWFALRTVFQ